MNKTILIGRLTKDPDMSTTPSGQTVCTFSIAISRTFKNQNGERETDFINIVCWSSTAENCHKFLKKGSQVAVYGRIQTRTYDAQDGTRRTITEVVAEEVEFIGSRQDNTAQPVVNEEPKPTAKPVSAGTGIVPVDDEGLPF